MFKSKDGQLYVIVVLTDEIRANYLKEAVNILLEIYGVCYIFDGEIQLDYSSKRQKCNWEMLPPGEMPSRHIKKQLGERGEKTDTYDIFRLEYMEKYNSEKIVEGINGFKGYYAFIFSKCCVLESAIYGNATYIIPKENWEILSQKTKKELFDENKVIGKIDHTAKWKQNVSDKFRMLLIEFLGEGLKWSLSQYETYHKKSPGNIFLNMTRSLDIHLRRSDAMTWFLYDGENGIEAFFDPIKNKSKKHFGDDCLVPFKTKVWRDYEHATLPAGIRGSS